MDYILGQPGQMVTAPIWPLTYCLYRVESRWVNIFEFRKKVLSKLFT